MWPLWVALRTYAPYVTFPAALVIGFVGYNIEKRIRRDRDKSLTYLSKTVPQEREERQLNELKQQINADGEVQLESLKKKKFIIPPTQFDHPPANEKKGFF